MSAAQKQFLEKGFGKHFPWLDVLNSQEWDGYGELTDYSADREWRSYFLKHWGFSPAERGGFPVDTFRSLRALLRRIVEKSGAEQRVSRRDLNELNAAMKVPGTEKLIEIHNGFRTELMPVRNDWDWMLGRIAASFAGVVARGELGRVKSCSNGGCRWAFYDVTKGNTRRWCSDKTCGNRERVRRARAAHKRKH